MKKKMRKVLNLFIVLNIFFVSFFSFGGIKVNAETIKDLQNELDELERQAKENNQKQQYTDAQIAQAKKDINQINIDIDNISAEIITKNKEIDECNTEIKAKDKEIKQLMEFVQLSQSNSFYLDYVMGADSLEDFIYRLSISEQLLDYNNDLINDMNKKIKENEQRKIDLNNKTKELEKKQDELGEKLKVLANEKVELDEYALSIEGEIAVARDVIKMYRDAGCKDNEEVSVCANRALPADSGFIRPITNGYVTSEYGYRPSVGDYHYGIDVSSSNKANTLIYPVAAGKVAKVYVDDYGANVVIIHHKIIRNGVTTFYSSTYIHLRTVYVKDDQVVARNVPIGVMGNTGHVLPKPTPSDPYAGTHLHLAMSTGLRYTDKDQLNYSGFLAHVFNPRMVVSFPSGTYNTWSSR